MPPFPSTMLLGGGPHLIPLQAFKTYFDILFLHLQTLMGIVDDGSLLSKNCVFDLEHISYFMAPNFNLRDGRYNRFRYQTLIITSQYNHIYNLKNG